MASYVSSFLETGADYYRLVYWGKSLPNLGSNLQTTALTIQSTTVYKRKYPVVYGFDRPERYGVKSLNTINRYSEMVNQRMSTNPTCSSGNDIFYFRADLRSNFLEVVV